jgi:hypothetical protein
MLHSVQHDGVARAFLLILPKTTPMQLKTFIPEGAKRLQESVPSLRGSLKGSPRKILTGNP